MVLNGTEWILNLSINSVEYQKFQTRDDSDDDDDIAMKTTRTMTKQQQERHDATGILAIGEVSDVYVPFGGRRTRLWRKKIQSLQQRQHQIQQKQPWI